MRNACVQPSFLVENFHDCPSDTFWRISSSCCPIPAEARFTCSVAALPSQTPVRARVTRYDSPHSTVALSYSRPHRQDVLSVPVRLAATQPIPLLHSHCRPGTSLAPSSAPTASETSLRPTSEQLASPLCFVELSCVAQLRYGVTDQNSNTRYSAVPQVCSCFKRVAS